MQIKLKRIDDAYHMRAVNEDGNAIDTDGSLKIGGNNKGMRPMQLLLAAVGSCSAIDIVTFLKKQRQDLQDFRISVGGAREKDAVPALYTDIHLHFELTGDLSVKKVERALSLSMEKYCSVAKTLEKTANITYDYKIIAPENP